MVNSWVRAYPPNVRQVLSKWLHRTSSAHFVVETVFNKERLVTDLSRVSKAFEDEKDANSLSPDTGYDDVQADYIDHVVQVLYDFIQSLSKMVSDAGEGNPKPTHLVPLTGGQGC